MLEEAKCYFKKGIEKVGFVQHKSWGIGKIKSIDNLCVVVDFPSQTEEKKLGLAHSLIKKIIRIDLEDFDECLKKYSDVLKREKDIPKALKRAEDAIQPYLEFLE